MRNSLLLLLVAAIAVFAIAFLARSKRDGRDSLELEREHRTASITRQARAILTDADFLTADESSAALEPAVARAATRAPVLARRPPLLIAGPPCTLRGRVVVARGLSPRGLRVHLRLALPPRDPIVLGDEGTFEWTQLSAGTYKLEASGLDDVVWRPDRYELRLQRGETREVEWDLRYARPTVVDVRVSFDGRTPPARLLPLFIGTKYSEQLSSFTALDGRARVRLISDERRGGGTRTPLYVFCTNDVGESAAQRGELCVGDASFSDIALPAGSHQELAVEVRTALVRVLAPAREQEAEPSDEETASVDVFANTRGFGGWYALGSFEVDPRRPVLGTFRAGPGEYFLRCKWSTRSWSKELTVTPTDEVVECQLD